MIVNASNTEMPVSKFPIHLDQSTVSRPLLSLAGGRRAGVNTVTCGSRDFAGKAGLIEAVEATAEVDTGKLAGAMSARLDWIFELLLVAAGPDSTPHPTDVTISPATNAIATLAFS